MAGLTRNNFYASLSNIKWYTVVMTLLGIWGVFIYRKVPTFLINFTGISIVGYSLNAVFGLQKELSCKWGRYKLTAPVTRAMIIKSYYFCHILWTLIGVLFASVWIGLSLLSGGYQLDRASDVIMAVSVSVTIASLCGTIFYPLFYLAKRERYEAVLMSSLLAAVLILIGTVRLLNYYLAPFTDAQMILSALFLSAASLCILALSFPLTTAIYRKQDC